MEVFRAGFIRPHDVLRPILYLSYHEVNRGRWCRYWCSHRLTYYPHCLLIVPNIRVDYAIQVEKARLRRYYGEYWARYARRRKFYMFLVVN